MSKIDQKKAVGFSYFLVLAVALRLFLIPAFPNISDDIYRFIWDGYLIHEGVNPLTFTPRYIIENNVLNDEGLKTIFPLLNSPDYFTIYPPISQVVFYISSAFGINDLNVCSLMIKIILLLAELLSIVALLKILKLLNFNKANVLGYLFYKEKWKEYLSYFSLFCLLLFIPFFITLDIPNFLKSIDLYFQKFEFNASIYYLLRAVGKFITGYNQIIIIGPLLALTTVGLILRQVFKSSLNSILDLTSVCLFSFVTYLFLTTTVHPWYLILPLAISVFNPKIYLIVWSFLITLSYSTYADPNFNQNYFLITMEYLVVFVVMIAEHKNLFKSKTSANTSPG